MNFVEWFILYLACLLPDALRDFDDDDEPQDDEVFTLTIAVVDV